MKKTSNSVIFFGNERLATGVETTTLALRALLENKYQVKAVVSNYAADQSKNARSLEVAQVTESHQLPLLLPTKLKDIKSELLNYNADIGVLVAYGKIVPEEIINIFPRGIVNLHPSLLPLHRGPTPIESVILDGDEKTGVSIMQLAKAMDAGPIYGQSELKLSGNESKQSLADTLLDIGQAMLLELLPGIINGTIVALPQANSRASYDNLLSKNDGTLDWQKPAIQLEREIRAFAEWPKSRTILGGKEVIITNSKVINEIGKVGDIKMEGRRLFVYCAQQALEILSLKPAGKPEMSAEAFISGYASL
ncbi:MAG TPA: methionyl-tRNA formyltransferase [Candidatus Saccharimonadales bacterium]|nr:methionyl-tRNA formyltransferase [Candidatus Saccharimonadales bacterium]